jgi:hypothetical protein
MFSVSELQKVARLVALALNSQKQVARSCDRCHVGFNQEMSVFVFTITTLGRDGQSIRNAVSNVASLWLRPYCPRRDVALQILRFQALQALGSQILPIRYGISKPGCKSTLRLVTCRPAYAYSCVGNEPVDQLHFEFSRCHWLIAHVPDRLRTRLA